MYIYIYLYVHMSACVCVRMSAYPYALFIEEKIDEQDSSLFSLTCQFHIIPSHFRAHRRKHISLFFYVQKYVHLFVYLFVTSFILSTYLFMYCLCIYLSIDLPICLISLFASPAIETQCNVKVSSPNRLVAKEEARAGTG